MRFLDGAYVDRPDGSTRSRWVKAPTCDELTLPPHTIARRVGRYLERQGLLERDAENSYLAADAVDDDPLNSPLGHSITYRILVGPQAGHKVVTLQALLTFDPEEPLGEAVGKVGGFSLYAGVAALVPRPRVSLTRRTTRIDDLVPKIKARIRHRHRNVS